MKRTFLTIILAICLIASGCATQTGQRYGTAGALGGALIGGALDGWGGAAIGGAAGALGGGLLGDTIEGGRGRGRNDRYRADDWNNEDNRGRGGNRRRGGYVRPCRQQREPVYNRYGDIVGHRSVCR